jgi:hypothetical protein
MRDGCRVFTRPRSASARDIVAAMFVVCNNMVVTLSSFRQGEGGMTLARRLFYASSHHDVPAAPRGLSGAQTR